MASEPERMARLVRETGATVVQTSPSVWSTILDRPPDVPRVRVAVSHGEAATPDLVRRLLSHGGTVWNLYGPTETTVRAVGRPMSEETASGPSGHPAPIGRPLPHLAAHVAEEAGRAVLDGARGELRLSGPSLARGCRGAGPEADARFARLDGAGTLHDLGRVDERIEPREIEAAIRMDPRIEHAAATWCPNATGAHAVAAAVVARPGVSLTPRAVHDALAMRLPRPTIPSRIRLPEAGPPRRAAARTPEGIATTVERARARSVSGGETTMRSAISSETGVRPVQDRPKSPRSMPPTQSRWRSSGGAGGGRLRRGCRAGGAGGRSDPEPAPHPSAIRADAAPRSSAFHAPRA